MINGCWNVFLWILEHNGCEYVESCFGHLVLFWLMKDHSENCLHGFDYLFSIIVKDKACFLYILLPETEENIDN